MRVIGEGSPLRQVHYGGKSGAVIHDARRAAQATNNRHQNGKKYDSPRLQHHVGKTMHLPLDRKYVSSPEYNVAFPFQTSLQQQDDQVAISVIIDTNSLSGVSDSRKQPEISQTTILQHEGEGRL